MEICAKYMDLQPTSDAQGVVLVTTKTVTTNARYSFHLKSGTRNCKPMQRNHVVVPTRYC
jgi:hypothetical protein